MSDEKTESEATATTRDHAQEADEYRARREREQERVRVKLVHLVGLIDVLAHENDQIRRSAARERLVGSFFDLFLEGPGPDPEDEARRKERWDAAEVLRKARC